MVDIKSIKQIEDGEWLYCGCFIQKHKHIRLPGNYVVFKNNIEQTHVGNAITWTEAKALARANPCFDNHLKF